MGLGLGSAVDVRVGIRVGCLIGYLALATACDPGGQSAGDTGPADGAAAAINRIAGGSGLPPPREVDPGTPAAPSGGSDAAFQLAPEDAGVAPAVDSNPLPDPLPDPSPDPSRTGAITSPAAIDREGCADIFAQDILPSFEVEISPDNWTAIYTEFKTRYAQETFGGQARTEYPITFRYRDELISDATLRLKGQSSWPQSAILDTPGKMQFVVSFNSVTSAHRFHGQRKLELDMPRSDPTFLRQRLAFAFLRRAGIPAPCANSARLIVNGVYYGLFTNTERMDKGFLSRVYPGDDDGDLWDGGASPKTNELTVNVARRDALFAAADVAALDALVDLEASVSEWAAEAMMPDADGYYGSGHNFYLYDHPTRGFIWLPHDKDNTFDRRRFDVDPFLWSRADQPARVYLTVLGDPTWFAFFRGQLGRLLDAYDLSVLEGWQAAWSAQITAAAQADANKAVTNSEHVRALGEQQGYFRQRAAFVREWLTCQADGAGRDVDGDGVPFCRDCADTDAAVRPGGVETCGNALDDDCDGLVDEGC